MVMDWFHHEWKFMVLALEAVLLASLLLLKRFFDARRPVRRLAMARLTKCNVLSSRKKIVVTIQYQYTIADSSYKVSEKIIRYPESRADDYEQITRTVIAGFRREPLLEVVGISVDRPRSHSVKESIKRRFPELVKARFRSRRCVIKSSLWK